MDLYQVLSIKDEDNMSSDSASHLANSDNQCKAYVDTEIAGVPQGDITAVTAGTGLSGGGTTGAVTTTVFQTQVSVQVLMVLGHASSIDNSRCKRICYSDFYEFSQYNN